MSLGKLCISIDLELAWGIWDKPRASYFRQCELSEDGITAALLRMFERHEVPVTWAFVGRLLDRDATRAATTPHGDRIWYAPHLLDAIARARPNHDLGSHGYGHIYFDQLSAEQARAELAAARAIHHKHGFAFESFVFPRNQVGHLDLLAEAGLRIYRSPDETWHNVARQRLGRVPGRLANLVDKALPITPTTVVPTRLANGLIALPGSMLLLGRAGIRRGVPPAMLVLKARRGLDAAAHNGRTFHLWFHPSNFYDDTDTQLRVLDEILIHASKLRDVGRLAVQTMRDHAAATLREA